MSAPAPDVVSTPAPDGPRSRTDRGWYLSFQLALLFAALMWMPFGARDAAGVSNVLPALRPAAPPAVRAEQAGRSDVESATTPPSRRLSSVAVLLVGALLVAARPRERRRPEPAAPPRAAPLVARHGRAPPSLG